MTLLNVSIYDRRNALVGSVKALHVDITTKQSLIYLHKPKIVSVKEENTIRLISTLLCSTVKEGRVTLFYDDGMIEIVKNNSKLQ